METVSTYEAKTQLSRLVARAEAGEETVITRHGRPVARLVPLDQVDRRTPGAWRGQVEIAPDFDEVDPTEDADWYGP